MTIVTPSSRSSSPCPPTCARSVDGYSVDRITQGLVTHLTIATHFDSTGPGVRRHRVDCESELHRVATALEERRRVQRRNRTELCSSIDWTRARRSPRCPPRRRVRRPGSGSVTTLVRSSNRTITVNVRATRDADLVAPARRRRRGPHRLEHCVDAFEGAGESLVVTDGLHLSLRDDLAKVLTLRVRAQGRRHRGTHVMGQRRFVHQGQIAHVAKSELLEFRRGRGTHPPQGANRQLLEPGRLEVRTHPHDPGALDEPAVHHTWLGTLGRQLGEELVAAQTHPRQQSQFVADATAQPRRRFKGATERRRRLRKSQKASSRPSGS